MAPIALEIRMRLPAKLSYDKMSSIVVKSDDTIAVVTAGIVAAAGIPPELPLTLTNKKPLKPFDVKATVKEDVEESVRKREEAREKE